MKKILFFLLLPFLALSQDVVSDTVYIQKQGNIYYIVTMTTFSDSTVTGNKQILGDSLKAINALVTDAERQSNTIAIHAKPIITKAKSVQRINYYNDLHVQISGKPVYFTTAQRDTVKFLGDWRLNFNGEIIDDTPDVIVAWNKANGIGILHKDVKDTLNTLDNLLNK